MPRTSAAVAHRKYELTLDLIRENQGITTKAIQKQIAKTFGHKFSPKKIAEARLQVTKEREAKKTVLGMERVGRATRLKEQPESPMTDSIRTELTVEQQIRDITIIIRKRLPGVERYHLDVNSAGESIVDYRVSTTTGAKIKI